MSVLLYNILLNNCIFYFLININNLLSLNLILNILNLVLIFIFNDKSIFWGSRQLFKLIKNWPLEKMRKWSWSSKDSIIHIILLVLVLIFNRMHHETINLLHLEIERSLRAHWFIFIIFKSILIILIIQEWNLCVHIHTFGYFYTCNMSFFKKSFLSATLLHYDIDIFNWTITISYFFNFAQHKFLRTLFLATYKLI